MLIQLLHGDLSRAAFLRSVAALNPSSTVVIGDVSAEPLANRVVSVVGFGDQHALVAEEVMETRRACVLLKIASLEETKSISTSLAAGYRHSDVTAKPITEHLRM